MPWKECSKMESRAEFAALARSEGANIARLCRRFGISRKTGYKWLKRSVAEEGLQEQTRRPHYSPRRTAARMEQSVLKVRTEHPAWGGRKIATRLQDLGHTGVPAASTVTEILRRHGQLDEAEALKHRPYQRFEKARPNELWQMDFKGHFGLADGTRCHALTVLDDHSRYALAVRACDNERRETVQTELINVFRRYGLPLMMLMDNGSPWGNSDGLSRYTRLTVWLLKLGVKVTHGRPFHPQTQGKDERFHRTLDDELLRHHRFDNLTQMQLRFEEFRHAYNHERPHEALGLAVPARHYSVSARSYPEQLPAIDYPAPMLVRRVYQGKLWYGSRYYRISKAFSGCAVGLAHNQPKGLLEVFLGNECIAHFQLPQN